MKDNVIVLKSLKEKDGEIRDLFLQKLILTCEGYFGSTVLQIWLVHTRMKSSSFELKRKKSFNDAIKIRKRGKGEKLFKKLLFIVCRP